MRQTFFLGRLFDIRVGVHVSWIVAYAFMVVSVAGTIANVSRGIAFGLGAICALLLFASVIAHEFGHALVARRYGVRTRGITLFLFGGVALLEREPPSPRADVVIALAGPLVSALIAALAFGLLMLLSNVLHGVFGDALEGVVAYVALANAVLAVFNLIPAFPMDGGRVLRAAIWRVRKSRAAATGAASIVGLGLASMLVICGASAAIFFHAWREIWLMMIGAFLLHQGWWQLQDSRAIERLERLHIAQVMEAA